MSAHGRDDSAGRSSRGGRVPPLKLAVLAFVSLAPLSATAATAAGDSHCKLTLELIDAESGDVLPGIVRARPDEATAFLTFPELVNRLAGLPAREQMRGWHSLTSRATVTVPRAPLTFEALSGIETEAAEVTVNLEGKSDATLRIALKRFFTPRDRRWFAGNTHLHLRDMTREADHYLLTVPKADGLDLVFLSYLERAVVDRTYISNRYTEGDLVALSKDGVLFGNGEEHRHNFGAGGEGFGHVMLLDIAEPVRPVSIGPGITQKGSDGIPLQRGIRAAREAGATVIWCHNKFGFEDVPNWAGGLLDAQNIFDGGTQGGYEDSYYRYLNIGLRVPFSTGTDWFVYDFSRAYVPLSEPLTVENWLAALARGESIITNGPILTFEAAGRQAGAVVDASSLESVAVRGAAVGRIDFEMLELVWNGSVVHAVPSRKRGGHYEADLAHAIPSGEPGWAALRVRTENRNELGQALFAHTSPVYIEIDGRSVFLPEVARGLIAEMEESAAAIELKGTFEDDAERDTVLAVYREGIRALRARLP